VNCVMHDTSSEWPLAKGSTPIVWKPFSDLDLAVYDQIRFVFNARVDVVFIQDLIKNMLINGITDVETCL
jgi:hypothetical protein